MKHFQSAKRIFTTKYESRGGPPDRAPPPIPPPKSTVPLQPPALPPKNVPPPVPPKKKSIEMILAEEAKAMGQHSLRVLLSLFVIPFFVHFPSVLAFI